MSSSGPAPPRRGKAIASDKVSPPLTNTRLSRLIYLLVLLSGALLAFYGYRLAQYKRDVGGWWNVALRKSPPSHKSPVVGDGDVQRKIEELAEVLGIQSSDLASAIAGAVHQYVPPASLSSIQASQTGKVIEALVSGVSQQSSATPTNTESGGTTGVAGIVAESVENFVGMDEP
ncbi:hypothetical protein DL96DRAFT_1114807 [Flagelloscypha sp. PMI_526]|nr:hypothetical protein DL96DRAFT_1114807 [Flagelloscypha sp. PMI_526]